MISLEPWATMRLSTLWDELMRSPRDRMVTWDPRLRRYMPVTDEQLKAILVPSLNEN